MAAEQLTSQKRSRPEQQMTTSLSWASSYAPSELSGKSGFGASALGGEDTADEVATAEERRQEAQEHALRDEAL